MNSRAEIVTELIINILALLGDKGGLTDVDVVGDYDGTRVGTRLSSALS